MRLYDSELDAGAYSARLMLSLLRLPHGRVPVNRFPGQEAPQVPELHDGDITASGTVAVLRHLAARYAPQWLTPGDSPADQWLSRETSRSFAPRQARDSALFTDAGPAGALVARAAAVLRSLDDQLVAGELAGTFWIGGARPLTADVAMFPVAALSGDYGVEHDEFPALRRWIRRFRALPGFITMPGIPQFY